MPIKIISSRDGFRRCGMAHSKEATTHPDGKFSKKEIEILQNESMLMVEIIPAKPNGEKSGDPEKHTKEGLMKMTVPEIKVIGEKYDCQETTKEKLVDEILAAQKKEG